MSIIAMVPLHELILDADSRKIPYDQYDLKLNFASRAVREQSYGGGFMTKKDRARLDLFEITDTLQDIISRRDERVQPEHAAMVHLALSEERGGLGFCLYLPKMTEH